MEILVGTIVGGSIGFLSSYLLIKHQHKLTTKQNVIDEIRQLKTQIISYIEFLVSSQYLYAVHMLTGSFTIRDCVLGHDSNDEKTLSENENSLAEERIASYTDSIIKRKFKFSEYVNRLADLKEIDISDKVNFIWDESISYNELQEEIYQAEDRKELIDKYAYALKEMKNKRTEYRKTILKGIGDIM